MQLPSQSMWIRGNLGIELDRGEKNGKRNQKGKFGNILWELGPSFGGQVAVVQGATSQNIGGQRAKGGDKGKQKGKQW